MTKPNPYTWRRRAEDAEDSSLQKQVVIHDLRKEVASLRAQLEALADHRRLVRMLDVAWNGEAGAAKQASLCDIVSQIVRERANTRAAATTDAQAVYLVRHPTPGKECNEWTEVKADRFQKFVDAGFVTRTLYARAAAREALKGSV